MFKNQLPKGFPPRRGQRHYSTLKKFSSSDFIEWFRGIADSEGTFRIISINSNNFGFRFEIGLHIDDIKMLEFIKQMLQMGSVTSRGDSAYFTINRQKEIKALIDIFSNNPLNTTKRLNFLDFKKAFELYTNSNDKTPSLIQSIKEIIGGMNTLRSDSATPVFTDFKITPYWLLGFVEGDGSFSVRRSDNFLLVFSLTQSHKEVALFKAIKDFICSLPGNFTSRRNYDSVVSLSLGKAFNNSKPIVKIGITNSVFLKNVLIPFFDALVWQSKKELDFQDFKTVLSLKEKGQHFTEEGINLIKQILNQMNNNRLSTSSLKAEIVPREVLQSEIDKLLGAPSNLEVKEDGRIFIKSLNKYYSSRGNIQVQLKDEKGLVIETFESLAECGRYLSISPLIVSRRLKDKSPLIFKERTLYIGG